MASSVTQTGVLFEDDILDKPQLEELKEKPKYVRSIVWESVAFFLSVHLGALYGIYLSFTSAKLATVILAIFLIDFTGFGLTAGAHRLWSHRSYKAKWPLRVLLMIMQTMTFQFSVINWVKEHRVHHKYSETDADPHNVKRGFFFAHIGWLLCRKHPEVKEKGKNIDTSDLKNDPILVFQEKYYAILMPLFCFILPTIIPVVFWNETWTNAFFISTICRYVLTLNRVFLVNSAAHLYGNKPYNKYINASDNMIVSILTLGEGGWHNYHHTFPWDYKTGEFGSYGFNFTTAFIDFFAKIGWAYDLKSVSVDMIKKRVKKTGDGSHGLWGCDDKDQTQEERNEAIVTYHHTKDDGIPANHNI